MKTTSTLCAAGVLILALALGGCESSFVAPRDGAPALEAASEKVRFAHLVGSEASAHGADGGREARLLIGFDGAVLDPDRLLKRYLRLKRYRLLKRYEDGTEVTYAVGAALKENDLGEDDDFDDVLEEVLDSLNLDDDVLWIEPDVQLDPVPALMPEADEQGQVVSWGLQSVGQPDGVSAASVDLYVLDSGADAEDLNLAETRSFLAEGEAGSKAHGTHVAGIAGALDNGMGVLGVAPGVRLRSFEVINGQGAVQLSTAVAALNAVRQRKLQNPAQPVVVNMSFGADVGSTDQNALDRAVAEAVAAGVVVVLSAGNDGVDVATVTPAHAPSAITVGAYNAADAFASFSNYGAGVDLLAPGVDVVSLAPGGALASSSGTSAAAPHVAAAAALYLAQHPGATPAEVHSALVGSARTGIAGVPSGTTNQALWIGDGFGSGGSGDGDGEDGGDEDDDEDDDD